MEAMPLLRLATTRTANGGVVVFGSLPEPQTRPRSMLRTLAPTMAHSPCRRPSESTGAPARTWFQYPGSIAPERPCATGKYDVVHRSVCPFWCGAHWMRPSSRLSASSSRMSRSETTSTGPAPRRSSSSATSAVVVERPREYSWLTASRATGCAMGGGTASDATGAARVVPPGRRIRIPSRIVPGQTDATLVSNTRPSSRTRRGALAERARSGKPVADGRPRALPQLRS